MLSINGITDMLVTNGGLFKVTNSSLTYYENQRFTGYGGLLNHIGGNVWHKKRLALDPAFNKIYLRSLVPKMNEIIYTVVQDLKDCAVNSPVDVSWNMKKLAIQLIATIGYGTNLNTLPNISMDNLLQYISDMFDGFFGAAFDPMFMYKPSNRLSINRTKEAGVLLRQLGHDALAKRRLDLSMDYQTPSDLLAHSIEIQNNNAWYTDEEIVDDFVTFIVAGHETTSNALCFILALLARHPEVYNKAVDEVNSVLDGQKSFIEAEDSHKLTYIECIIKESLRLYPVVSMVRRSTHTDTLIGDYIIPKDTQVMTFPFIQGRTEKYWKNSTAFQPERFLDKSVKNFTFIPFLTGPRKCIGINFAMLELKLVLAQIILSFYLKAPDYQNIRAGFKMTLFPTEGTLIYLVEK